MDEPWVFKYIHDEILNQAEKIINRVNTRETNKTKQLIIN